MSITHPKKIDGMADGGDTLVLAVSDHLRWDMERAAHLSMLQEKLNTYIRFFDSGEYMQYFDGKRFDSCRIEVYFLHNWHESFDKMLEQVSDKLEERHITIKCILKDREMG